MEFTLTDNGTITHNELTDIHNQMTLVDAPEYLYFLAAENVQTIKDFSNVWTSEEIEELFISFLFNEHASENTNVEIMGLMLSGEFNVATAASMLLWNEDAQFAKELVKTMTNSNVDSEALFNKLGINETPLADALIASKNIPMGSVASAQYVFAALNTIGN